MAPKLVVTAQGQDFDANTLQKWKDEGFDVSYLALNGPRHGDGHGLQYLADGFEFGETYAIVGQSSPRVRL